VKNIAIHSQLYFLTKNEKVRENIVNNFRQNLDYLLHLILFGNRGYNYVSNISSCDILRMMSLAENFKGVFSLFRNCDDEYFGKFKGLGFVKVKMHDKKKKELKITRLSNEEQKIVFDGIYDDDELESIVNSKNSKNIIVYGCDDVYTFKKMVYMV
jgi:hypothetical protein